MKNMNDGMERLCSDSSAEKPKYKHVQNFQDAWCSTDKDMESFSL
jgi:hypothetical protein